MAVEHEAVVGWRYEHGVESKMLVGTGVELVPEPGWVLSGGLGFSLVEHPGLASCGLGMERRVFERVAIEVGVSHEQWNGWRIGENRLLAVARCGPLDGFRIGFGVAYRAPVFDPDRFASPFFWRSEMPEWNVVYSVEARLLRLPRLEAWLAAANLDRGHFYTPSHVSFQAHGSYRLGPDLLFVFHAGSGVKGLSGLLFSLSEVTVETGVRHAL